MHVQNGKNELGFTTIIKNNMTNKSCVQMKKILKIRVNTVDVSK